MTKEGIVFRLDNNNVGYDSMTLEEHRENYGDDPDYEVPEPEMIIEVQEYKRLQRIVDIVSKAGYDCIGQPDGSDTTPSRYMVYFSAEDFEEITDDIKTLTEK